MELLTGAAFFTAVYLAGPTYLAGKLAVFAWLQIGLIFADLDTRLLPDQFTRAALRWDFCSLCWRRVNKDCSGCCSPMHGRG